VCEGEVKCVKQRCVKQRCVKQRRVKVRRVKQTCVRQRCVKQRRVGCLEGKASSMSRKSCTSKLLSQETS